MTKNLELRLISDPLEEEKRYSIAGYDNRYEFREKKGLWKLAHNNLIKGQVTSSEGCHRIYSMETQSGQLIRKEIGLYRRILNGNDSYLVEITEDKSKEETHPLEYLLRVVSSKILAEQEAYQTSLDKLASTTIAK